MKDFFDRLDMYMNYSGLNDNKLTVKAQLSIGALGKQRKGSRGLSTESIAKILHSCPDLNADWLLTGRGEMIVALNRHTIPVNQRFDLYTDHNVDEQRIPLYDIEASAGIVSLFTNTSDQIAKDYLILPNLPSCDGAILVRGDSMYPILKSGDIVLYKIVKDFTYGVLWGEMYIVSYVVDGEEYVVVKYVQKSEEKGCIRLVSHNAHHSPQDIPFDRVQALALIKASVRYNTN